MVTDRVDKQMNGLTIPKYSVIAIKGEMTHN
jgi:hypothetical protein